MSRLINNQRPLVFCPGCTHSRVVDVLGRALDDLGLEGNQVVVVSDIGCSGLFDTFFHTHALHGLHGRALTYATGLKMAQPDLTVVVTMGDGGLGIGGAHVLSACRRNLDMTLLVLNNFNYGMTGGQCSATTPEDARTSSGFLNQLEPSLDICQVAASSGAPYADRISAFDKDLTQRMGLALAYDGFALMDIWGVCPGRFTRQNPLTPRQIDAQLSQLPEFKGPVHQHQRQEYGTEYRRLAQRQSAADEPQTIHSAFPKPFSGRHEVLILGRAGQRIKTAGEILCLAAMTSGLHGTQKDDYPITVLRGHSLSEVVLSDSAVGYTGLENPSVVIALANEGVERRRHIFNRLERRCVVIAAADVDLPDTQATTMVVDFKSHKLKSGDWALAALAHMAFHQTIVTEEMLKAALGYRFDSSVKDAAMAVVQKILDQ